MIIIISVVSLCVTLLLYFYLNIDEYDDDYGYYYQCIIVLVIGYYSVNK